MTDPARPDGPARPARPEPSATTDLGTPRPLVLVAHPGAELYGSDRVLLESVSGLVQSGARVVVTVPAPGPLVAELERRGATVELTPALVLRKALLRPSGLPELVRRTAGGLVAGHRLLRRLRPAVVYVNTVTVPLWLPLARAHRARVLCHVHEGERSAPAVVRFLLALPVAFAHVVVVNSRFSTDTLASALPGIRRRCRIVYNGVPGPAEVVPAREDLDGGVRLVYVGRLSPRKGVDVAVDAVARLVARGVDAHLDLVGAVFAGYEWYEQELREQVARLGLQGRVAFRGFQDPVWDLVAAADVALVPSRVDEPFGNTAVEAVLCARPVVVSATSGLLEAARGYGGAQGVTPGDPDAIADAVVRVVQEWPTFRAAAHDDAAEAVRRHSPATYRQAVAEVVRGLLAPAGRRRPQGRQEGGA